MEAAGNGGTASAFGLGADAVRIVGDIWPGLARNARAGDGTVANWCGVVVSTVGGPAEGCNCAPWRKPLALPALGVRSSARGTRNGVGVWQRPAAAAEVVTHCRAAGAVFVGGGGAAVREPCAEGDPEPGYTGGGGRLCIEPGPLAAVRPTATLPMEPAPPPMPMDPAAPPRALSTTVAALRSGIGDTGCDLEATMREPARCDAAVAVSTVGVAVVAGGPGDSPRRPETGCRWTTSAPHRKARGCNGECAPCSFPPMLMALGMGVTGAAAGEPGSMGMLFVAPMVRESGMVAAAPAGRGERRVAAAEVATLAAHGEERSGLGAAVVVATVAVRPAAGGGEGRAAGWPTVFRVLCPGSGDATG